MSRQRSGRPASGGAARPGVFVQTPESDIYVTLLGIALGAMVLGCLLLLVILYRYEFRVKVSALTPSPAATAPALALNRPAENLLTVHL